MLSDWYGGQDMDYQGGVGFSPPGGLVWLTLSLLSLWAVSVLSEATARSPVVQTCRRHFNLL